MFYLSDALLFLFLLTGLAALSWWRARPERTPLENLLLPMLAMLGLYSLVIWAQGLFFGLAFLWWPIILALIWPIGVAWNERWKLMCEQWRGARRGLSTLSKLEWSLVAYLLLIFVLTFVLTLAPPAGNDYDSLVYHLAAPLQYLRAGRVVELRYDHHSYFPFGLEMLFLTGLALKGAVFAKLFHWLMLPLCCGVLLLWGRRFLSTRAGLFAAALFASLPVVQATASTAYVDLGLAAWALAAFYCLSRWLENRETNWLWWCGLFCGLALGAKYLGALTFGFLLAWALVSMARERKFDPRAIFGMAVIALLVGGGWYLRNWVWTGNPVYPFAYGIFGGEGWTAKMAADYQLDQMKYGFGRAPLDWLMLPWRVAMAPLNLVAQNGGAAGAPFWPVSTEPLRNSAQSGLFETLGLVLQTVIGPALLAFGVPLLFMRRKPRVVGLALWAFLFFSVFWGATGQYIRYLIPAFGVLCLPCGWGMNEYLQRSTLLKWTSAAMLGAWLLFAPLLTWSNAASTLPVILGGETPEQYLTRAFPGYEAMRWASRETPPHARFAVYGEPRDFYLDRDYFWADDPHNNLIDYDKIKTADELVRALQNHGATHVLWNTRPESNGGFGGPPPQINDAIASGRLRHLFGARGYEVFEIVPGGKS